MSKIRITQPGMETYTGFLSDIEFEDGVSLEDVTKMQAQRIAGAISMMMEEDGLDPSAAAELTRFKLSQTQPEFKPGEEVVALKRVFDFTEEALMDIADKKGIAGLREFAEPYGVKSNSIMGLIDALLSLKANDQFTAES
ncbi:MAG: hypothetical protein IBX56_19875 [Methylomicrobium sp.]|nr:hypothetical protein [Methylomicrobium sp.]